MRHVGLLADLCAAGEIRAAVWAAVWLEPKVPREKCGGGERASLHPGRGGVAL